MPTPAPSRFPFGITTLEPRPRPALPTSPQPDSTPSPESADSATAPDADTDPAASDEGTAADLAPLPEAAAETLDRTDIARGSRPTEVMTIEDWLQAYTYDRAAEIEPADLQERFGDWLNIGRTLATELAVEDDFVIAANSQSDLLSNDDTSEATEEPNDEPEPVSIDDETEALPEAPEAEGTLRSPIVLEINRDRWVCLARSPQTGLLGAWVSPEGALLGEPEVIRSTGYEGFNRQAIERIQTLDFSTVEQLAGYQFEVQVNYDADNCLPLEQVAPTEAEDMARDRVDPSDSSEKAPAKVDQPDPDSTLPDRLDDPEVPDEETSTDREVTPEPSPDTSPTEPETDDSPADEPTPATPAAK